MSFLKKLFGLGGSAESTAAPAAQPVDYQGYRIRPAPYQNEGQYQTAGTIEKDVEGETRSHYFVRADRHASHESAVEFTVAKARQIIDEQGDRIFK